MNNCFFKRLPSDRPTEVVKLITKFQASFVCHPCHLPQALRPNQLPD